MARSEAVREEVLELDGRRCQICGADESLEVHHIASLGMGGSEELDTAENMITLCSGCHRVIHAGVMRVSHWDRDDKKGGLVLEQREGDTWMEARKRELWFYKRQDAEMLEQEIEMVREIQLVESKHARIMAHIWENYMLISDAASPESYVAQLGVDSTRAQDEVDAIEWIDRNGLEWPPEVNLKKVALLMSVKEITPEIAQRYLDGGKVDSYSTMHKNLIDEGLALGTLRWYLLIGQFRRPLGWIHPTVLFVRSRDIEVVLARKAPEVKVLEINAFRAGIKWDRKAQKLFDGGGNEVAYEEWEKADDE